MKDKILRIAVYVWMAVTILTSCSPNINQAKQSSFMGRKGKTFEYYIMPEPNTGCWIWSGASYKSGCGMAVHKGKTGKASRISYRIYKGEIPEGLCVLHTCDVPACVNPDHLFLGTNKDNSLDMMRKGRCGTAKLTPDDVIFARELYKSGLTCEEVGQIVGVTGKTISMIKTNRIWAHLTI